MPRTGSVVERESACKEFEWKIQDFTLADRLYSSPGFNFQNETWEFCVYPKFSDEYIGLRLWRRSSDSLMNVEISVALKTSDGQKSSESGGTDFFDEWKYMCYYQWMKRSEFERRVSEFLSSGCLTFIITLKRVDFVEPARRRLFFRSKYKNNSAPISHESLNLSTTSDVAQNENVSEKFQWRIDNFSLNNILYESPQFLIQSESWVFAMFPNRSDGYIGLRLQRNSSGFPLLVEFSVALKTSDGQKSFERGVAEIFDEWKYGCHYQWMRRSEFERRLSEFLSSGCLTVIITLKIVDAVEPATAIDTTVCSSCKESLPGDKIAVDKKYLDKPIKCPNCAEVFSLQAWFDHECPMATAKADDATAVCSCCEEKLHDDKIAVHKKCLDKLIKYSKSTEVVRLQNTVDPECQKISAKGESDTEFQPEAHSSAIASTFEEENMKEKKSSKGKFDGIDIYHEILAA